MRLVVVICLLAIVLAIVCSTTTYAPYPPKLTAWDNNGTSSIAVEGPDNPTYPYQDIKWWDRWVWENRAQAVADSVKDSFVRSADRTFLRVYVDESGYMMPMTELTSSSYNNQRMTVGDYLNRQPTPYKSPRYHFWILVDNEMSGAILNETRCIQYQHYPVVPKWLINLPTMQRAIALPDGRWVVVVYQDESPDACSVMQYGKYENYLLYSADGKLLPSPHKRQASIWYDMMWDYVGATSGSPYAQLRTEDDVAGAKLPGPLSNAFGIPGGYTALVDFATNGLLALYDYDGKALFERDKVGNERTAMAIQTNDRYMYCVDLEHRVWQQVYDAQNK